MTIYLDYSATTPVAPEVLDAMYYVYKEQFGNAASRTHIYGQQARKLVEDARAQVASVLGVEKEEVVFTSGATESNNLSIMGLAHWGLENGRKHIVSDVIEHKSVLEPLYYLSKKGFSIDLVPVNSSGRVDVNDVYSVLREDTLLVSIMHVNNETGVIQPVQELGDLLSGTKTFFHVDAAQSFGKCVEELRRTDYDLLSVSGHKIYGPQGIGALILRRKNKGYPPIKPLMFGGGHEKGLRPGTLPVALIVGLGVASSLAERHHVQRKAKAKSIKASIIEQLKPVRFVINGDFNNTVEHVINISFPGIDSEAIMVALKDSYAISNGSACTSSDYKPSHVLNAMGLSQELIDGAVRISWGQGVSEVDLTNLIRFVKQFQL